MSTTEKSAVERLLDRMLNFRSGTFDGYPSMFCSDEGLIWDALAENPMSNGINGVNCPIAFMAYLASENAKSKDEIRNALAYIDEYVSAALTCNFHECGNAQTADWYDEVCNEPKGEANA